MSDMPPQAWWGRLNLTVRFFLPLQYGVLPLFAPTRFGPNPRTLSRYTLLLTWLSLVAGTAAGQDASLLQSWRFHQDSIVGQTLTSAQGRQAQLRHAPMFDDGGCVLSGKQFAVVDEGKRGLPDQSFSVEAWVRIDQPIRWGAIVGYQQDNGSYERGWSLGYNQQQFEFRVSDGDKLVNCTADRKMTVGSWHHVVGVCDTQRKELLLFLDGQRVATAAFQAPGPVYPHEVETELVLGAYKDRDELFPMSGRLREARVYAGVLSEPTILSHVEWRERLPDKPLKFAVRPGVRFLTPKSAELRWETTIAGQAMVAYGVTRKLGKVVTSSHQGTSHRVLLSDLKPGAGYFYRFGLVRNGKRYFSPFYELDGSMNYMPPVISAESSLPEVDKIMDEGDQLGGYAVVLAEDPASWAEAI
ncbi:MAG: hypothetical protein MI861_27920, partial [Pirellulales bacterium]|nr:hypothetical protein [Pirellulales bacterium]